MTRARWLTGGVIAAGALVVAGEALASYVAGRLVVGVVAVLVLMGVLVIGFASLLRARRYIARELTALGAEPPAGALYLARRAQTLELRRRGVTPDLDVLADATAAEEAERGYTGKYLVATTVLIGLVGTFGGLMETLARVSPLLKGERAGGPNALALIAGPLAGLHVTFGTSVVAIMVTLALALIQGDVTLHHERLLATLQERTRHVLVPELWPTAERIDERTVRALIELRTSLAETLAAGAATSAAQVAAVVRAEVQRLVDQVSAQLRETATASREAVTSAATASREAMTAAATASGDAMMAAATASRAAMTANAAAALQVTEAAATLARDVTETTTKLQREAIEATTKLSRDVLEAAATSSRQAVDGAATSSRETIEAATTVSRDTVEAAAATLAELRGGVGAQLEGTARALTTAAAELHETFATLSPALVALAPQLGALAAEVALLAARADAPEQTNAVLDELVRLGEDVERLVTSSRAPAPAAEEISS